MSCKLIPNYVNQFRAKPTSINSCNQLKFCRMNNCYIESTRPNVEEEAKLISDEVWTEIQSEASSDIEEEPFLSNYYFNLILSHQTLESALSAYLAKKLSNPTIITCNILQKLLSTTFANYPEIGKAVRADLKATKDRDPACSKMLHCFLYYKGFLALQAQRVAHQLWQEHRTAAALLLQSRITEVFAVDIHPGAKIGSGVLLDHATGVVIGETAVVGNDVTILHGVTLGGTGKEAGDRHPKLGNGVLVGAGTKILGNVSIGEGSKIGAGSVVLKTVPAGITAVGNPARLIAGREKLVTSLDSKPELSVENSLSSL